MKTPAPTSWLYAILLLLNRVPLGLLFLFAGVRKLLPIDWVGTYFSASRFLAAVGDMAENLTNFVEKNIVPVAPLPPLLARGYGYALPFVEILAGALLVMGFFGRISAGLIALMLLSFMLAMGINWWPERGGAFDKNIVLFTLAVLLFFTGPGRLSIDNALQTRWGRAMSKP